MGQIHISCMVNLRVGTVWANSSRSARRSCLIRSVLESLAEASNAKQTENIRYLGSWLATGHTLHFDFPAATADIFGQLPIVGTLKFRQQSIGKSLGGSQTFQLTNLNRPCARTPRHVQTPAVIHGIIGTPSFKTWITCLSQPYTGVRIVFPFYFHLRQPLNTARSLQVVRRSLSYRSFQTNMLNPFVLARIAKLESIGHNRYCRTT